MYVLSLKQSDLWSHRNIDSFGIEGDENAIPLGLFFEKGLVTILSLYGTYKLYFGKFVAIKHFRNQSFGSENFELFP